MIWCKNVSLVKQNDTQSTMVCGNENGRSLCNETENDMMIVWNRVTSQEAMTPSMAESHPYSDEEK